MQLILKIPDAAPGATTADPTLLVSWGTTSAQSKLQGITLETAFGHFGLQLTRLQHHGAISDDDDVLRNAADLSSHLTSLHQSQSGSLYVTALAHGRGSFVSSDAVEALAEL